MDNYMEMKEQLEKNQESLDLTNRKSIELDNNSKEVKEIMNDLKQEDKDKLAKYIEQVDKTNTEYKNIDFINK